MQQKPRDLSSGEMFQVAANLEVIYFPQTARVVHISGFQHFYFMSW